MPALTERRFKLMKPILERYRTALFNTGHCDARSLERELHQATGLGYTSLKFPMVQLAKQSRYKALAAYYMEHVTPLPAAEFKRTLRGVYGVTRENQKDYDALKARYWARTLKKAQAKHLAAGDDAGAAKA